VAPDESAEPPVTEPEPDREIRIGVMVDGSQSMAVSDPPSPDDGRGRVQRALDELVSARLPEAAILLAEASGFVSVLTQCDSDADGFLDSDCFTRDETEARAAISRLHPHGLVESWSANVADLEVAVRSDVALHAAPATAQWVVIIITDEGGAVDQDADDAAALVAALRADVEMMGAGFVLSAVVLDTPFAGAGAQVASPLAEAGGGSLQRVPPGDAIDLTLLIPGGG
jgi:hypothetical protein